MTCHELPPAARELCAAFVGGLKEILHTKLHGVYLYGAFAFQDSGPTQDLDERPIPAMGASHSGGRKVL